LLVPSIPHEVKEERLRKAIEAVNQGRVKKYVFIPSGRVYWVVVGRGRDYWVIPGRYCSCDDFFINVVARSKVKECYHLKAQEIAEREGKYEEFKVEDSEGERLIEEWRSVN